MDMLPLKRTVNESDHSGGAYSIVWGVKGMDRHKKLFVFVRDRTLPQEGGTVPGTKSRVRCLSAALYDLTV